MIFAPESITAPIECENSSIIWAKTPKLFSYGNYRPTSYKIRKKPIIFHLDFIFVLEILKCDNVIIFGLNFQLFGKFSLQCHHRSTVLISNDFLVCQLPSIPNVIQNLYKLRIQSMIFVQMRSRCRSNAETQCFRLAPKSRSCEKYRPARKQ